MNIRVFDTINPTAFTMQSAMMWNMLSARVMLVQNGALYARGRERTMHDFHEKFLGLKNVPRDCGKIFSAKNERFGC